MPNENNIPIAAVAININEDDLVLAQEINHSSNIIVAERAENYDLSGNNEILVAYQDIDFNNVDRTTIDVILHKRSKLLKMFWVILLFNIILFFFNPTSIVCCITLVYNIFTIKFPESLLLESAIICNLLTIFIILISNILISVNISNIALLLHVDILDYFQYLILYFLSLLFISTCVICFYIYFI